MKYKKELKESVKSTFGACLGTFIGMNILPYLLWHDTNKDMRRMIVSGIGILISFVVITIVIWLIKIAKCKRTYVA